MSAVEVYEGEPMTAMAAWARDATEIANMAAKLVQTSFVPASFNGKPAEATAAILTGLEVGLKPMAALRSIVVVNGTPALTAQALRGLAQAAGHRIWVDESTSQRAVVKGIRRGDDQVQTSVWDVQRATAAGLMQKAMYKGQSQSMFVARATSELVRLIASDVVMGLAYSIEELQDEVPVAPEGTIPTKAPSRTVKRAPLDPQRGEAPEPDGAVSPQEAVEPPVDDTLAVLVQDAEPTSVAPADADAADAEALRIGEQRRLAAEAFLDEPPVDWDPPAGES